MLYTIKTQNNITIYFDNKELMCSKEHKNYDKIIEEINKELPNYIYLESLFSIENIIKESSKNITIKNGEMFFKEIKLNNKLIDRILDLINENFDVNYLILFLDNLYNNDNIKNKETFIDFIENNKLPISKDGHFYAYDINKKNTYNKYGDIVKDESFNLYFHNYDYISNQKDDIIENNYNVYILKINPLNIKDINNNIGYCNKYVIVDNIYYSKIDILKEKSIYYSQLDIESDEIDLYINTF